MGSSASCKTRPGFWNEVCTDQEELGKLIESLRRSGFVGEAHSRIILRNERRHVMQSLLMRESPVYARGAPAAAVTLCSHALRCHRQALRVNRFSVKVKLRVFAVYPSELAILTPFANN